MFLKIVIDSGFENFENIILVLFENSSCFLNLIYIYIYIYIYKREKKYGDETIRKAECEE